jgi:hypothetical protein
MRRNTDAATNGEQRINYLVFGFLNLHFWSVKRFFVTGMSENVIEHSQTHEAGRCGGGLIAGADEPQISSASTRHRR